MKYTIIALTILLSACTAVPVDRKFPSIPTELQQACPDLKTINTQTTKLSEVVDIVVTNYDFQVRSMLSYGTVAQQQFINYNVFSNIINIISRIQVRSMMSYGTGGHYQYKYVPDPYYGGADGFEKAS